MQGLEFLVSFPGPRLNRLAATVNKPVNTNIEARRGHRPVSKPDPGLTKTMRLAACLLHRASCERMLLTQLAPAATDRNAVNR